MLGRRRTRREVSTPPIRVIDLRDVDLRDVDLRDVDLPDLDVLDTDGRDLSSLDEALDADLSARSLQLGGVSRVLRRPGRGNHPLLLLTDEGLKVSVEDAEAGRKLRNAAASANDEDTDMPTAKTSDAPRVVTRKHIDDPELRRQMRETYDQLGRDLERSNQDEKPSQRVRVRL